MSYYFVILSDHKKQPISDIDDAIAVMSAFGLTKAQLKEIRQEDAEAGGWIMPLTPEHEKKLLEDDFLHVTNLIGSLDVELY